MAATYKAQALALAKSLANNEAELEEQKDIIDIMGAYHYIRYMNGIAEDTVDFIEEDKHVGETWEYNPKKRAFVRIN